MLNYIQRKCDDKTLSHDQVFDPDKVSNINKAKFIDALNQEFEAEHPEEADDFRKRIEGIDRDINEFEADVDRLVQQIAPMLILA